MKLKLLSLVFLFVSAFAKAQVGIGTTTPQATLDIPATDPLTPGPTEGILIPRVDEFPTGVTVAQDAMMIFITGNGAPAKGFYYYDNGTTSWILISGTTSGGGTLDEAYDFGGGGNGNTINATDGAVIIEGEDGLLVSGTFQSGDAIGVLNGGSRMYFNPRKAAFRAGRSTGGSMSDGNVGESSIGLGFNTLASGENSIAIGSGASASGENAVALGRLTTASGDRSTAFGFNNEASGIVATTYGTGTTASGDISTSFGFETTASGEVSTAFGRSTVASGEHATAFGELTDATGENSTAFGRSSNATGQESTAFGFGTDATGNRSTAFGILTTASGFTSTAFGYSNTSPSQYETTLGVYATEYTPLNANGFEPNDRLFTIGNGELISGVEQRSNALTIYKSGLMNINDAYNMPLADGTSGQVMTTDGAGNVTFEDLPTFSDTDNQQIDILNLNGTDLEISLEDDGIATQTLDLSSLQDGSGGTLDDAYDFGGAGNGNTITATDGAVTIDGEDGFLVTGNYSSGETITTSGAGARMLFNPRKAAFRVGRVTGNEWDDSNVGLISIALGNDNVASGSTSTAFGFDNVASGILSTAFGSNNVSSGILATSFGYDNSASGDYALVFGRNNLAPGDASTVFGFNNRAVSLAETTLGANATIYSPTSPATFNNNDRLFTIGNGLNSANRSNALTIYKSGLMNINDAYNMPLADGTSGQIMSTDGAGNVTFQDGAINTDNQQIDVLNLNGTNLEISLQGDGIATQTVNLGALQDGTGSDNQQIDVLNLNGTNLEISLQDDGIATQTVNLGALQDGTGSDNQQIDVLNLNGTNLEISLQDDGVATEVVNLASLQDGNTQNTLDQAYDEGGAGAGRTITVDNGAVQISGNAGGTTATTPAQLILTETQANDFSRLRFTNSVETTNTWTIAARTDNDATLSRMNFNHNGAGDLFQLWGDGFVEVNGIQEIDGQLGVNRDNPTYAVHLPNSTTTGTGRMQANAYITYSDSRVKSEQQLLQNGLATLLQITPKKYFHHTSNFQTTGLQLSQNGESTVGFIAQELYEILPEAVQKPTDETKELWSVDYDKVIPIAVKAIQELKAEKNALSKQVQELEVKVQAFAALEARIQKLENKNDEAAQEETPTNSILKK